MRGHARTWKCPPTLTSRPHISSGTWSLEANALHRMVLWLCFRLRRGGLALGLVAFRAAASATTAKTNGTDDRHIVVCDRVIRPEADDAPNPSHLDVRSLCAAAICNGAGGTFPAAASEVAAVAGFLPLPALATPPPMASTSHAFGAARAHRLMVQRRRVSAACAWHVPARKTRTTPVSPRHGFAPAIAVEAVVLRIRVEAVITPAICHSGGGCGIVTGVEALGKSWVSFNEFQGQATTVLWCKVSRLRRAGLDFAHHVLNELPRMLDQQGELGVLRTLQGLLENVVPILMEEQHLDRLGGQHIWRIQDLVDYLIPVLIRRMHEAFFQHVGAVFLHGQLENPSLHGSNDPRDERVRSHAATQDQMLNDIIAEGILDQL
mmetsp:Transcript_86531/g.242306  ORF Transcript_86531/g.242306 Transcript_86531/m.242306 type:complete len:378 (+) Transcript_86531:135-1268(+)